jgi:hypothetical protein
MLLAGLMVPDAAARLPPFFRNPEPGSTLEIVIRTGFQAAKTRGRKWQMSYPALIDRADPQLVRFTEASHGVLTTIDPDVPAAGSTFRLDDAKRPLSGLATIEQMPLPPAA